MFNTFNLFNFFQQPNTGKIPEPGTFNQVDVNNFKKIVSGKVSDYNWYFPYIDRAIDKLIFLSSEQENRSTYQIVLYSESEDLFTGIRRPFISNNLSGCFFKDSNSQVSNINFSGSFFPHKKDFSNSSIFISGILNKSPSDYPFISNLISGKISDFNFNFNNLNNKLSGALNNLKFDFNFLNTSLSGEIKRVYFPLTTKDFRLSGIFFPIDKDFADINYDVLNYSAAINFPIYNIEKSEEFTNLDYYIYDYKTP